LRGDSLQARRSRRRQARVRGRGRRGRRDEPAGEDAARAHALSTRRGDSASIGFGAIAKSCGRLDARAVRILEEVRDGMERRSVEAIFGALNGCGARYLVVGGLAVVAHGYVRLTADIDLVLDPDPGALKRAIAALESLGYRPRAPVEFAEFADAAKRR